VLKKYSHAIEIQFADNGTLYNRNFEEHAFIKTCQENKIEQKFARIKTPRTNGKTKKVAKIIMEMRHNKTRFKSGVHWK